MPFNDTYHTPPPLYLQLLYVYAVFKFSAAVCRMSWVSHISNRCLLSSTLQVLAGLSIDPRRPIRFPGNLALNPVTQVLQIKAMPCLALKLYPVCSAVSKWLATLFRFCKLPCLHQVWVTISVSLLSRMFYILTFHSALFRLHTGTPLESEAQFSGFPQSIICHVS